MKIVENTDRRLVIEHRPWVKAGIVWALGLTTLYRAITGTQIDSLGEHILAAALGVGVTYAAWRWFAFLRITFDRDTGQVEHRALRPFGSRSRFIDLAKVGGGAAGGEMEQQGAPDPAGAGYRGRGGGAGIRLWQRRPDGAGERDQRVADAAGVRGEKRRSAPPPLPNPPPRGERGFAPRRLHAQRTTSTEQGVWSATWAALEPIR